MLPAFHPVRSIKVPIFRQDIDDSVLFYAPGYLALIDRTQSSDFEESLSDQNHIQGSVSADLLSHAGTAYQLREDLHSRTFNPTCLTLYLNNECNLNCIYCYSAPSSKFGPRLSIEVIRSAAELVAKNCQAHSETFTLVFHGGGEPSLNWKLAEQALDAIETITDSYDLAMFRYIATNGVMTKGKAAWLASRFDLIGISCDGPEEFQSRHKPLIGGGSSTPFIERTVRVIHDSEKPLIIRTTITPETINHQEEIASYLCAQLNPQEIHVEPVFVGGRFRDIISFRKEQADEFIHEFLKARQVARRYGASWQSSGSRPQEIHATYCNVLRNVLNLIPAGVATTCFKHTDISTIQENGFKIGSLNSDSHEFVLDTGRIAAQKQRLNLLPPACMDCFNQYHCALGCPDRCFLDGDPPETGFRCRINQHLTMMAIQETADKLRKKELPIVGEKVII